jgi:hypothetical protein
MQSNPMCVRISTTLFMTVVLASCGGGTGGGGTSSSSSPANSPQIVSVGANSSLPLAPLRITTSGGDSNPVTVTYSDSGGFSVSASAIEVSSGSVTTSVPIYVNPKTMNTDTGTVSIVLSQNGRSSQPVSFTIQDLPPISSYGTSLGQITHAFMIFENLMLGHSLNEMQTMQQALANDSNAVAQTQHAAYTLYTTLIPASNKARSEVDQIIANNSATFSWGTVNENAIQFDAQQLDFTDRVLALYLLQQFGNIPAATSGSARMEAKVSGKRTKTKAATVSNPLQSILDQIQNLDGALGLMDGIRKLGQNAQADAITAADGTSMLAKSLGAEPFEKSVGLAVVWPKLALAISTLLNSITPIAACVGSPMTCDNATELANAVDTNGKNVVLADMSAVAQSSWAAGFLSNGLLSSSESLASSISVYQAIANGDIANLWDAASTAVHNAQFANIISSSLGVLKGTATISNSAGPAASLTGIQLQQCSGASCNSNFDITGVADQGGSYDLVVPLQVPGVNYASMDIVAFDFDTNTGLSSQVVDLTGLDPSHPIQVPPITGTCNDPDRNSTDGDDPDCD